MSKYKVVEIKGEYAVGNSTGKKYYPNTLRPNKESAEAKAALWNAKHEMEKALKCMEKAGEHGIKESMIPDLSALGHTADCIIEECIDHMRYIDPDFEESDPRGFLA